MCNGLEKATQLNSGVKVVYGCLTEGGSSFLGALFFVSPYERSCKTSD